MHPCTYTSQKTKKSKKWLDGFITVSNRKVVIHNESRKVVYSSASYSVVDDTVDTPAYLVYTDDLGALFGGGPAEEPEHRRAEEPDRPPSPHPQDPSVGGRNAADILNLFRERQD